MIVVFCVGHLLNLVINVLGTFVHTSRLQYIEFFNKFYEEGGTPFAR
jgi:V/A-type H+-transporting ATPase subunit I